MLVWSVHFDNRNYKKYTCLSFFDLNALYKNENKDNHVYVDLFTCRCKDDDPDVDNLLDILMTIILINVEDGGDIFPTSWWWWLT